MPPPADEASSPFFDAINRMAARTAQVTKPVFAHAKHAPPQFSGSGILARLLDVPFFITAAHVQDNAPDSGLLVGSPTGIVPLYGRRYVTRPHETKGRDHDQLDIAVLRLDAGTSARFTDSDFLRQEELAMAPTALPSRNLLVVGFPASIQRTSPTRPPIHGALYTLLAGPLPTDDYSKVGYSQENHLLVSFDRKDVWRASGKATSPALEGLSGGGVWYTSDTFLTDPAVRLAGIVTAWHPQTPKCIIASRLIVPLTAILKELGIFPRPSRGAG